MSGAPKLLSGSAGKVMLLRATGLLCWQSMPGYRLFFQELLLQPREKLQWRRFAQGAGAGCLLQ